MRDIVVPSRVVKRELIILLVSLVSAFLLNVYSIVKYGTSWKEIYNQIHVVLGVALLIYVLVFLFRLIISPIFRLFIKK
jgi:hypothetical protein